MRIKNLAYASTMILMMACEPQKEVTFTFDEVTYSPQETVFKLFAPEKAKVSVVLDGDSIEMNWTQTAQKDLSVYMAAVEGDHKNKTYEFVVNGQSSPGVFAKAVTVNGQKGVVLDMKATDPAGWAADKHVLRPWQDLVVYEMHHRDFSVGREDAQNKGKFLALTEPWAIEHLKALGVNAVVIGALDQEGNVDPRVMGFFMEKAEGLQVTFHRAFDECRDPFKALEDIISLGCHRLLTAGHAANVNEGLKTLRKLKEAAGDRITILAGSGVRPANIAHLEKYTGIKEFHSSSHGPDGLTSRDMVARMVRRG